MTSSNAWAEFAAIFTRTRAVNLEHEQAKAELKGLMPEDAKEAIGHGVRAKAFSSPSPQIKVESPIVGFTDAKPLTSDSEVPGSFNSRPKLNHSNSLPNRPLMFVLSSRQRKKRFSRRRLS